MRFAGNRDCPAADACGRIFLKKAWINLLESEMHC
jgi:hypothetical protein